MRPNFVQLPVLNLYTQVFNHVGYNQTGAFYLRIGIETECLNHSITGVQLATLDLIKGLIEQNKQLTCFHTKSSLHPHFEKVQHHLFRYFPNIPFAKTLLSVSHSSCFEQVDILHFSAPRFSYLIKPQVPLVLTVHDMAHSYILIFTGKSFIIFINIFYLNI